MDHDPHGTPWTRQRVEARLVAAFRAMPWCPIFRRGPANRTLTNGRNAVTAVLDWASLLDRDPDGRAYLWAWARCQATRESFSEHCSERGWRRSTAEAGRRRGAEAIARSLSGNEPSRPLDTKKTRVRSNVSDVAASEPVVA